MTGQQVVSRTKANNATKSIIERAKNKTLAGSDEAEILRSWRRQHTMPLQLAFQRILENTATVPDCIVSFRLKRIRSILDKLCRPNSCFKLGELDDIGGCRIIVNTVQEVYAVAEKLQQVFQIKDGHGVKDYIHNPQRSGYRSLHMIVKVSCEGKDCRIEVQIRTRLQHLWSTSVEAAGEMYVTNYKNPCRVDSDTSPDKVRLEFFRVVSCLFAIQEGTAVLSGYSTSVKTLSSTLTELNIKSGIVYDFKLLGSGGFITDYTPGSQQKGVYILDLYPLEQFINVTRFDYTDIEGAVRKYNELESKSEWLDVSLVDDEQIENNVVLVSLSNFEQVRFAYPNYAMQVGGFLSQISPYIRQAPAPRAERHA